MKQVHTSTVLCLEQYKVQRTCSIILAYVPCWLKHETYTQGYACMHAPTQDRIDQTEPNTVWYETVAQSEGKSIVYARLPTRATRLRPVRFDTLHKQRKDGTDIQRSNPCTYTPNFDTGVPRAYCIHTYSLFFWNDLPRLYFFWNDLPRQAENRLG